MEDDKTFYDLLCEGVEVGDLVDAIEAGKVRIFDKFGRDNQKLSGEDKNALLAKLEYHQKMIGEKALPGKIRSQDCYEYWQGIFPFLSDAGGDLVSILDRVWIYEEIKETKVKSDHKTGKPLGDYRWRPHWEEVDRVAELARPYIERGRLKHNDIADEIMKNNEVTISRDVIIDTVKGKCYEMGRKDLIKGLDKTS
jgi:hypothetical protein